MYATRTVKRPSPHPSPARTSTPPCEAFVICPSPMAVSNPEASPRSSRTTVAASFEAMASEHRAARSRRYPADAPADSDSCGADASRGTVAARGFASMPGAGVTATGPSARASARSLPDRRARSLLCFRRNGSARRNAASRSAPQADASGGTRSSSTSTRFQLSTSAPRRHVTRAMQRPPLSSHGASQAAT